MGLEEIVRQLQDRVEIEQLLYSYCRHADLLDPAGMAGHFIDDCRVRYVAPDAGPPFRSRRELEGYLRGYLPDTMSSSHHVSNIELRFDSPDKARASTYLYSWQRFRTFPSAADRHRWGRYELEIVRTADGWRFSKMQVLSAGEYGGTRSGEQFAHAGARVP